MDLNDIPRHAFLVVVFSSPSDTVQLRLEAIPNHWANLLVHEKVFFAFVITSCSYSCNLLFLLIFLLHSPWLLPITITIRNPNSWTGFSTSVLGRWRNIRSAWRRLAFVKLSINITVACWLEGAFRPLWAVESSNSHIFHLLRGVDYSSGGGKHPFRHSTSWPIYLF